MGRATRLNSRLGSADAAAAYVPRVTSKKSLDLADANTVALPYVEQVVIPPAALLCTTAESAWYSANRTTLMRFTLERAGLFEGVTFPVVTASGNIEFAIYSVTRSSVNAWNSTKIASTGVVACPSPAVAPMGANSAHLAFPTPVKLQPGQYALGLWVDNTTATFAHVLSNSVLRAGWSLSDTGAAVTTGAPSAVVTGPSSGRAFAATLEGMPAAVPTVLFGDSITAGQTWFTTANGLTGARYSATNKGIGGNTSADMLARLSADVLALTPRLTTVLAGANDLGQSISSATTIANLSSIVSQVLATGSSIVLGTVTPRLNTGSLPLDSGQLTTYGEVNAWIRAQASPSVRVADWSMQLSTGDGVTPNPALYGDHVHPSTAGHAVMASVLAPLI